MSESITINFDDLTVGEIELIEDHMDLPIDEVFKTGTKKGKLLRVLAYVDRKRSDPTFTMEQAGDLKVSLSDKVDPTGANSGS